MARPGPAAFLSVVLVVCLPALSLTQDCTSEQQLASANVRDKGSGLFDPSYATCDQSLAQRWYRAKTDKDLDLATTCPSVNHCGTIYPIWMNGTIPLNSEGTVGRTACVVNSTSCCASTIAIRVYNCGSYRLFYLSPTPSGSCSAYCLEPAAVITTSTATTTIQTTAADVTNSANSSPATTTTGSTTTISTTTSTTAATTSTSTTTATTAATTVAATSESPRTTATSGSLSSSAMTSQMLPTTSPGAVSTSGGGGAVSTGPATSSSASPSTTGGASSSSPLNTGTQSTNSQGEGQIVTIIIAAIAGGLTVLVVVLVAVVVWYRRRPGAKKPAKADPLEQEPRRRANSYTPMDEAESHYSRLTCPVTVISEAGYMDMNGIRARPPGTQSVKEEEEEETYTELPEADYANDEATSSFFPPALPSRGVQDDKPDDHTQGDSDGKNEQSSLEDYDDCTVTT